MEFHLLLDAPDAPARRMQIAKLGDDFQHARYGTFSITADDVQKWQRNLALLPGGRAPIDEDHMADREPRRTEASGWITGVSLDGNTPMADVEWTPKGEAAIREKRYLFISPTYGRFTDEHGETHENTLTGAALTNKPFLTMPTLTLASEERVSEALDRDPAQRFYVRALDGDLGEHVRALTTLDVSQAERDKAKAANNSLPDGSYPINNAKQLKAAAVLAASKHGDWQAAKKLIRRRAKELGVDVTTLPGFGPSDSRRTMDKALLTALGLDGDNDLVTALAGVELDEGAEKKLLDAATALRKPEPPEPDTKTLEQQATAAGMTLLDSATVTKLLEQAAAGAEAQKQLHGERFERAFDDAVKARKVTPAEHDSLQHFYTLDADATLKAIDARQPIMLDRPHGAPALEFDPNEPADPQQVAAAGLDPSSHELDRKIKAKLKELGKPLGEYMTVLDAYHAGEITL